MITKRVLKRRAMRISCLLLLLVIGHDDNLATVNKRDWMAIKGCIRVCSVCAAGAGHEELCATVS
jgi:hypothetical protein